MYQDRVLINDFEFYYLVELTRKKIKPLSRFEKPVNKKTITWLKKQGFYTELIQRKLLSRKYITETVFSKSIRYIDLYKRKFDTTFLKKDDYEQRLEGFFFGYPSCCVEQYIIKPYIQNALNKDDQSLLFHWACPNCRITPELLPLYKQVYKDVKEWFYSDEHLKKTFSPIKFPKVAAALLLFTGLLSAQSTPDTTHFIPLPGDINNNCLSYAEEIYLGMLDNGAVEDCQTWAKFFKAIIDTLPTNIYNSRIYKLEHLYRGVIQCPKCGEYVNMGYITLVNPRRHLEMNISCLGLHFMEHGFFSYGDNTSFERVDIDTLKRILFPFDSAHLLPVANDSDGDGLTDAEEDSLWMDYTAECKDFDDDGVLDGVQIAEELIRLFPKLKEDPDGIHSNIEFKQVWGSEECQICGSIHNMGTIEIFNPENNRKYEIPILSLHTMAHGSFAYDGTVHQNDRLNVIHLYRTMKTHVLFTSDDADNDGLKDDEERYFGFDPNKLDSNNDGVSDGMELALTCVDQIRALPTEPSATEPYVEHLGMDGIHKCAVCGKEVVMGVLRIFNPLLNTTEPLEISYYAFHFLEQGSFACEGAEDSRIDPIELSHYLNMLSTNINPGSESTTPEKFILEQNFPNPFNSSTTIKYRLCDRSPITLKIYDTNGQEIKTLVNGVQSAGPKSVTWDGTNNNHIVVGTGIYIYRLISGNEIQSKKMLLIK
jgi:hypothetical protein